MASLLLLLALNGWHDSLPEAKQAARTANRPVLAVLLTKGDKSSESLKRALGRSPIKKLLSEFACVELNRAKHPRLVAQYNLRHSPSTIILSSLGTPLKLIVGPTSPAKYAAQLKNAIERHKELWNPRRPRNRANRGKQSPREFPRFVHSAACPDGCPHCGAALIKARRWLTRRQLKDGRWSKPNEERERGTAARRIDRSIDQIDVSLTALGGLAFLGEEPAKRAAQFLESCVRGNGVVRASAEADPLYTTYAQFETPLAALFLAAHDPTPRPSLQRIAKYLVGVQDQKSGAWGYAPDFREHPALTRRGWRLLATTHCCLSALNALPGENEAAKKRAARYLMSCRGRDALFAYRATDRRATYPGATAGALYALMRSGVVAPESLEPSWTAFRKRFYDIDGFGEHRWFFLLFTGLAMHQRGPGAASAFHRHFRDLLVHEQSKDGSYEDPDKKGGSVLATAIAASVLRNRYPSRPAQPHPVPVVAKRSYLPVPHTSSRVKVFERNGRYWVDLVVSFDRPLDDRYRAAFRSALIGANRTLYDVTDGQMSIHTVDLHGQKGAWDKADLRVSREFYDRTKNPHPWAHGITQLSTVTELSGGTKKGRRIGNWILFPPDGINWADPRIHHVLAHELCHYLFGAKDEYHQRTGESFCACILGRRGVTELCGKDSHTDDRQEHSCWRLAKRLYPKLREPKEPDPGPWDPPGPEIGMVR